MDRDERSPSKMVPLSSPSADAHHRRIVKHAQSMANTKEGLAAAEGQQSPSKLPPNRNSTTSSSSRPTSTASAQSSPQRLQPAPFLPSQNKENLQYQRPQVNTRQDVSGREYSQHPQSNAFAAPARAPVPSYSQLRIDKMIASPGRAFDPYNSTQNHHFAHIPSPSSKWKAHDHSDDAYADHEGSVDQVSRNTTEEEIQRLLALPDIDVPPEMRKPTPIQMSCELMEHQKVALNWLIQQEEDNHKKGGLLADTMGLGKTIQALALILARPPKDNAPRTTLIIAPLALLKQWQQEIKTKVKPQHKLKTFIFHGKERRGMTAAKLMKYDVVLTTYASVMWELKRLEKQAKQKVKTGVFILAKDAKFHRVILDEAHNIKNRMGVSSRAVCLIKAEFRLCLTGTPFMNRTSEIYALIRFLRIKPYSRWEEFQIDIERPLNKWDEDERDVAMTKLQALFRSITLRRTKDSVLDGQPILNLPAKHIERVEAAFDKEQMAFYVALEKQQQLKLNKYIRAGTVGKNYAYILVLLLRLRQACCHPHLIKDHGIPDGSQLGPKEMRELASKLDDNVVERIKAQGVAVCPFCEEVTENPVLMFPCGHYLCGACFTVRMELRGKKAPGAEAEEEDADGDSVGEKSFCPADNCREEILPNRLICHNFFAEIYLRDQNAADSSDEDDDGSDDENGELDDILDSDVDKEGNLKGFIDDGSEYDDSEDEDLSVLLKGSDVDEDEKHKALVGADDDVGGPDDDQVKDMTQDEDPAFGRPMDDVWAKVRKIREQKEAAKNEKAAASDSDSFPSLGAIAKKVKTEAVIPRSRAYDDIILAKRKRNQPEKAALPRKKAKKAKKVKEVKEVVTKTIKGKGNKKQKRRPVTLGDLKKQSNNSAAAKAKYLKRLRKEWVSSAKIDKTMELLQDSRKNNPKEKTLIFSLWTSFLDLLEIPVHDEGFVYQRYDGSMKPCERDEAVKAFMEKPDVQVMLVSLTAGNSGLNLTRASKVIMTEPFWNPYVEDQAVDRAHRIGQENEVTVHRTLVENTVEDRILALQDKKRKLVNAALSEEGAQGVSRLSVSELKGLFGLRR